LDVGDATYAKPATFEGGNGGHTNSNLIMRGAPFAGYAIQDTGGSTDNKWWDVWAYGNVLYHRIVSDDGSTNANWLTVVRNGVNVSTVAVNGRLAVGTTSPTSNLQVVGLPVYADNTAATAAGLTAGAFYRTATGVVMVVF
jgi:hypothetical protein